MSPLVKLDTPDGICWVTAVILDPTGQLFTLWEGGEPHGPRLDLTAVPDSQPFDRACRLEADYLDPDDASAHMSLRLYDADGDWGGVDLAWIRKEETLCFSYFGWPRRPALVRLGEMGNLARLEPDGWYNAQREAYGTLVLGDAAYLDDQVRDWSSGRLLPADLSPLGPRQRLSTLAV